MNLYAVNKFSQAVAAVLAAAVFTVSALAGGITPWQAESIPPLRPVPPALRTPPFPQP